MERLEFLRWGLQSCLDPWSLWMALSALWAMVGGYHLIMSVISFVAFHEQY